jgi:hypothetical protein
VNKTQLLRRILYGEDGKVDGLETDETVQEHPDGLQAEKEPAIAYDTKHLPEMSWSVADRLTALEASEELKAIYAHPQWHELMAVLCRARCAPLNESSTQDIASQVRSWAMNHPHISPLLAWFHACTARYGLAFDPFSELPTSRQQEHEREQEEKGPSSSPLTAEETEGAARDADASATAVGLQLLPDKTPTAACGEGAGNWQYLQEQQIYLQQQAQTTANAFYFYQQPMNGYY